MAECTHCFNQCHQDKPITIHINGSDIGLPEYVTLCQQCQCSDCKKQSKEEDGD